MEKGSRPQTPGYGVGGRYDCETGSSATELTRRRRLVVYRGEEVEHRHDFGKSSMLPIYHVLFECRACSGESHEGISPCASILDLSAGVERISDETPTGR
ncbi:hypothetical protein GQ600_9593 [Phytophthora cactorum]|nr:hypothetical protein GQ600_9593 [Phytophthora cactorum]